MEEEKPYSCEVCSKHFKNPTGLNVHLAKSLQCNSELKLRLRPNAPALNLSTHHEIDNRRLKIKLDDRDDYRAYIVIDNYWVCRDL